jgi:hypothetical protein
MTMLIDYIEKRDGQLSVEGSATRLVVCGANAIFPLQTPASLRQLINSAVNEAVQFYSAAVQRSEVDISESDIEEVSFLVVTHFLYMYNLWKSENPERYRHVKVALESNDLGSQTANTQIHWYAQSKYGKGYRPYGAALMGMSLSKYEEWEEAFRRYCDR